MITIEELRKVYQASYSEVRQIRNHLNVSTAAADIEAAHEAGLLAVARFVAERQRAVEPTEEMEKIGYMQKDLATSFRAMQSVAPLVVPE